MIYHADCKACGSRWQVVPPQNQPLNLQTAIKVMTDGLCPECGNDGGKAPVNWRFTFSGNDDPHHAAVRRKPP